MRGRRKRPVETFECPHCGELVKVGALACRECGSDVQTGWQSAEEIDYQSLELPEGYGDESDQPGAAGRSGSPSAGVVVVALVVAAAMALWAILG